MERVLIILLILGIIIIVGVSLNIYGNTAEPFVLYAHKTSRTQNPTGRYSDMKGDGRGFYHCKKDDDKSEENSNLPTCSSMREGMIQNFKENGQIPEIPAKEHDLYPPTNENIVTGDIANLQVILNRTAHPYRRQMCVPFEDCGNYINPKTKRLYCPVGMPHYKDSSGNTIGCQSFPRNPLLYCSVNSEDGDGTMPCSVLSNIQTVESGFEVYPPVSVIQTMLHAKTLQDMKNNKTKDKKELEEIESKDKTVEQRTVDSILDAKTKIVLNMIASYPNVISKAEKSAQRYNDTGGDNMRNIEHLPILDKYYSGIMESYLLYQPNGSNGHRVGFIRSRLTPDIPDIRAIYEGGKGPDFEIKSDTFIPDTMNLPDDIMPVLKPLKQSNYRPPHPASPFSGLWGWLFGRHSGSPRAHHENIQHGSQHGGILRKCMAYV